MVLLPGAQRMGLLTMLMLGAAGYAIAALAGGWPALGRWRRAGVLLAMGLLALLPAGFIVEALFDVPLGIDLPPPTLLPSALNLHPGRTSPNAALAFLALDLALLSLTWPRRRLRSTLGFGAVLVLGAIGATALTGHALGLEDLYRLAAFNRMLSLTALALCLCAVGLWPLIEGDEGRAMRSRGGRGEGEAERQINRRAAGLFALVTVVGGVAGFAVLRSSFEAATANNLLLTARTTATSVASEIEANLWYPKVIVARSSVRAAMAGLAGATPSAAPAPQGAHREPLARLAERFFNAQVTGAQFLDPGGNVLYSTGTLSIGAATVRHALKDSGGGAVLFWADGYVLETRNDIVDQGRMVGVLVVETRLPRIHELLGEVQDSSPGMDVALCSAGSGAQQGSMLCGPTRTHPRGFSQPLAADPASVAGTLALGLRGQSGARFVSDAWEADGDGPRVLTGSGSNVISAFAAVKKFGLVLGVRSDVASLYAPLRGRVLQLLLVLAAVVAAGTLILRSQVRPLVAALGREQRRAARILENCNDAFIALDGAGRVTDWNAQACQLFGWTAAQALGRPLAALILPPASQARFAAALSGAAIGSNAAAASERIELETTHRDGRPIPVEMSLQTESTGQGEVAHVFVQDVSRRQAAEAARRQSEQRLRLIADHLPALVSYIDRDFRYRFFNNRYLSWFGLDEAALQGRSVTEMFGRAVFEGVRPQIERAFAGETVSFELRNTVAGAPAQMEVHYIPDRDSAGRVVGVVGMVVDQTAQHEARERVQASERQLRAVTDNLPVLIAYVDAAERLVFLNGTFRDWLGVNLEQAAGQPMIDVIGPELYAQRREQLHLALAGERQEFDVESRTRRGRRHLHTIYIPDRGDDGRVRGVFTLSMDVTRLKLVEEQLRNLSTRDALTGLPNRRQLDDRLGLALARHQRERAPLALMFLDIDHFKQINDSHGHGAGDAVLQQFAARLAGDEFIVIIEGMKDVADAVQVADKILDAVRRPMPLEHLQLSVTTSIGIAVCAGAHYVEGVGWGDGVLGPRADQIGALTRARLMEAADRALYRAKHAGRDCYQVEQLGSGLL